MSEPEDYSICTRCKTLPVLYGIHKPGIGYVNVCGTCLQDNEAKALGLPDS